MTDTAPSLLLLLSLGSCILNGPEHLPRTIPLKLLSGTNDCWSIPRVVLIVQSRTQGRKARRAYSLASADPRRPLYHFLSFPGWVYPFLSSAFFQLSSRNASSARIGPKGDFSFFVFSNAFISRSMTLKWVLGNILHLVKIRRLAGSFN